MVFNGVSEIGFTFLKKYFEKNAKPISETRLKTGFNQIRISFSLKPSWDQDEHNDIRYSQIGSAVFELLDDTPHIQTDRHPITLE